MAIFPSTSIASAAGGFDIPYSCRFDRASSSKFTRATWTSSAADRRKWTYSVWFKVCGLPQSISTARDLFYCGSHDECMLSNSPADTLDWFTEGASSRLITNRVFRDVGAWYHAVFVMDTTLATAGDRMKIYINGVRETSFSTNNTPTQNHQTKFGDGLSPLYLGSSGSSNYWDGYFSEAHFVQGQALDASSFGEVDEDYGHWKAKKYSGSHGDGFYLDFKSSGTLGNDAAGGTDLTPSNLAASDQMLDSPTNNFATMNSIAKAGGSTTIGTCVQGDLKVGAWTTAWAHVHSTIGVTSGKWYFEAVTDPTGSGSNGSAIGICDSSFSTSDPLDSGTKNAKFYGHKKAKLYNNDTGTSNINCDFVAGDILQIAFDLDNGKMWFGKNGTWFNNNNASTTLSTANPDWTGITIDSNGSGEYTVFGANYNYGKVWFNFGQDSTFAGEKTGGVGATDGNEYGNFYYAPPSGHLALCTKNISNPAVVPSEHFNTITYDNGAGAKTGVGFQPDLVWLKSRGSVYEHEWTDAVRGVTKALSCDSNVAESIDSTGLTAFGADGFTVGTDNNYDDQTGDGMVAWNWKANGSGASNTDGTINTTSTSANVAAGFSIVSYTGTEASSDTIGHGLSKAPEIIILKRRTLADDWLLGTLQPSVSVDWTDYFKFHTADAVADINVFWNDTAPTASVFTVGTSSTVNSSSHTYIAYCWHSVEGYSKIGQYKGNGSLDGTFVHTGFRPAYIIMKAINNGAERWNAHDSARSPTNVSNHLIRTNTTEVEYTASWTYIDFLSNGFKIRATQSDMNNSTYYYLYWAFAETPFKYANAR